MVTRPAHQARELSRRIEAAGGTAILFPVLEIRDVEDPGPLAALINRLDEFDLAIFVSPNAVEKAMGFIGARRALPPKLAIAAIGAGGVKQLARFGVRDVITPAQRYDSEAMLELPALKEVAGKRVAIFRGDGGRDLLGDTLAARGAHVEYAECYCRGRPGTDPAPLLRAWARNALDAVTVTSSEGLRNLFGMVGACGAGPLRRTPLFVPHPRIAEAARALGSVTVVVTGPGDDGLLAGLTAYFTKRDL